MAELTMNRCIHAAVLRDLDRIEGALRAAAPGDRDRLAGLQRAWANLRNQLTRHHEGEDAYIWPLLRGFGVSEDLIAEMESEHADLAAGLARSGAAIDRAATTTSQEDIVAAADSVAETRGVVAHHLTHEEQDVEPVLIARADSPEWKAAEKKLRAASPTTAGWFFAWLLDGASPEVEAHVRSLVPGPVIFVFGSLFGRGYHRTVAPVWQ